MDRLSMLLAVHHNLVHSAELPEGVRHYNTPSRINAVEEMIMEELKKEPITERPNDEIPF